jgi:hypothetical protein
MIPRKVKRDGALPGRTCGLPDICDANRVGLAGAAEAGGGGVGRPCAVFKRQQQAQGNRKGASHPDGRRFILLILFIVISSD